jgi:hypothetical protein
VKGVFTLWCSGYEGAVQKIIRKNAQKRPVRAQNVKKFFFFFFFLFYFIFERLMDNVRVHGHLDFHAKRVLVFYKRKKTFFKVLKIAQKLLKNVIFNEKFDC